MEPSSSIEKSGVADWACGIVRSWQAFWFTPAMPHTLALVRILGGAMMLYTHLVWGMQLTAFLGENAWTSAETAQLLNSPYAFSYLYYVQSPALLWILHIAALIVFAMLTLGLFTRTSSILACIVTISYSHRLVGMQFGLDQVNAMFALYLVVGPCGAVYSLDRWVVCRKAGRELPIEPSVAANIAIRLIQVHLCVIYLFGGISKLRGAAWWDGSAVWMALASYEYQSLDMTWLGRWPWVIALMSHITVFWETFYCVLVWPRWSRPIMLALAVVVHGGIAMTLGMPTFGLAMIIANIAFVSPRTIEEVFARLSRRNEAATINPQSTKSFAI